jgi:hypothetical protein
MWEGAANGARIVQVGGGDQIEPNGGPGSGFGRREAWVAVGLPLDGRRPRHGRPAGGGRAPQGWNTRPARTGGTRGQGTGTPRGRTEDRGPNASPELLAFTGDLGVDPGQPSDVAAP